MSKLTLVKPEIGKPDATEDVKIVNALTAIENWANGLIDSSNIIKEGVETVAIKLFAITTTLLANESVTESKLAKAVAEKLLGKERVTEEDLTAALQAKINSKVEGAAGEWKVKKYSESEANLTGIKVSATKPGFLIFLKKPTSTVQIGLAQIVPFAITVGVPYYVGPGQAVYVASGSGEVEVAVQTA